MEMVRYNDRRFEMDHTYGMMHQVKMVNSYYGMISIELSDGEKLEDLGVSIVNV
jgi:hypothetical protein